FTTQVYGTEVNFIKNFDFLPGALSNLGLQSNGYIMNTRFPIRLQNGQEYTLNTLPDQAKYGVNVALFYEDRNGFSARVAWNRIGKSWDGRVSGATNLPGADNGTGASLYQMLL